MLIFWHFFFVWYDRLFNKQIWRSNIIENGIWKNEENLFSLTTFPSISDVIFSSLYSMDMKKENFASVLAVERRRKHLNTLEHAMIFPMRIGFVVPQLIGWLNKNKYYENFLEWYISDIMKSIWAYSRKKRKRIRSTCSSCQWHSEIILSKTQQCASFFDLF